MGLFGLGSKGKSGGLINVIRCDEPEYLVWKWRPAGQDANSTSRENSIRWGSSLRVKKSKLLLSFTNRKMALFRISLKDHSMRSLRQPIFRSSQV